MTTKALSIALALALILSAGAACNKAEEKPAGTPIEDLVAAGKAPVEAGSLVRGMSPIAPTFTMTLSNLSSSPVSAVNGTVIFFDGDGKALADTVSEAGYTDLSPIPAGGKIELQLMTPNEKAVSGKWIVKDVIYEKPNPLGKEYGTLPYKWTNSGHDAALEAEKAK